jgi:hypothetical protein
MPSFLLSVGLALCCAVAAATAVRPVSWAGSLPLVEASGTHYEVGFQIGTAVGKRVEAYFAANPTLVERMKKFLAARPDVYAAYVQDVSTRFPRLVEEVNGFADGAVMDKTFAMLVQFQFEINSLDGDESAGPIDPSREHCSDVHVHLANGTAVLGHNEDGDTSVADYAYFSSATYTDAKPGEADTIFAFHYPGALAGNAFSANAHLVITNNALFPKNVLTTGTVRNFANRDALRATTIHDCAARSTGPLIASGFNLNIAAAAAAAGDQVTLLDVEVSPAGVNAERTTALGTASPHFNNYLYLNVSSINDTSSVHRLDRYNEFPMPGSVHDIRQILGDTKDAEYPIFRRGMAPDAGVLTLATFIVDWGAKVGYLWVAANPKTEDPTVVLAM